MRESCHEGDSGRRAEQSPKVLNTGTPKTQIEPHATPAANLGQGLGREVWLSEDTDDSRLCPCAGEPVRPIADLRNRLFAKGSDLRGPDIGSESILDAVVA